MGTERRQDELEKERRGADEERNAALAPRGARQPSS